MNSSQPNPSRSWRERALRALPAGSNGEFGLPPELVPVLQRGAGPRVWDTEGREFLDFTMAWGAALPGHARPEILAAAAHAATDGANFAAVHYRAVELAERLLQLCPCAERVRFVASGTEATLLCLRVAHAATGRRRIVRFEGAYHGQHPVGVAGMIHGQPRNLPACDPSGAGAPWVEHDVLVAPYNHLDATANLLRTHASDIAAVIVEPFHRCLSPAPGFLEGLRAVTRDLGIVLIFDEVVTGFRFAPGGAQQFYGVTPDLAAYGKALGGGFPIGAYAGRADLMDAVNEHRLPGPGYAWSASTTGGNPVSCAAALATLDLLCQPGIHDHLHQLGRDFRRRLVETLAHSPFPAQVLGEGPIAQIAFTPHPVTDHDSYLASDRVLGRKLMLGLVQRGIFLNPMGTKLYLSLAHTPTEIDGFCSALRDTLADLG